MLLALVAHAGANVLNDYFDARNGADDANQQGLFPFTGGSRLIQNGAVSVAELVARHDERSLARCSESC